MKIFFGACAGVGKTYAMLRAAHEQKAKGVLVGVGAIETHGRPEIHEMLVGLPVVAVDNRHHIQSELDLDAALGARFRLLLVDELAHSNGAESRHSKRWQDVGELLNAGIDIYTTLNVHHLDSLSDVDGSIVGTGTPETIPDRIFDTADEVILVDASPEDLLSRLDTGKIHFPVSVEYARQNFFRTGNLIALRELVLRRMADRVNSDVLSYRVSNAVPMVLPTRESLMVCVRADLSQERLLRDGARLARLLEADWIAVHVERPNNGEDHRTREVLLRLAKSAASLGAEFSRIPGGDIARTLLDYARARNVTKLVMGYGVASRISFWQRPLSERIASANPKIGLVLLGPEPVSIGRPWPSKWPKNRIGPLSHFSSITIATLACGLTTLVASWLLQVFDLSNIVMLFLLTVVFVALWLGRVAGGWTAFLCVACLDFFFVEPRLSFAVSDTQYVFTFALMLAVALVISQLAVRLKSEAKIATAGERRATAIARVARDLTAAIETSQVRAICSETIAPLFDVRVGLVLPDAYGRLIFMSEPEFVDMQVAQWAYDHMQPAGLGTGTLNRTASLYLPLKAPTRARGVLALLPRGGGLPSDPDDRRLLDACCSSIALALERIHLVEAAQDALVRMEGERLRNALLAAVSHDLKTPLTAIRGLAETLERPERLNTPEQTELARAIRRQAEELQRLVANLLDLARMQSEGVRLNKEWHALGEIVGSGLARIAPTLAKRQVRTDLPADIPLVELDALLFERVLVNLLDNAVKYTKPGSTISIGARAVEGSMRFFVEDDGPGLPSSDVESLFEAFTRGQKESAIAGVGLGLALCRSIVNAHGGTIRAEQLKPHGARFEIRLPLGTPPEIERESAQ